MINNLELLKNHLYKLIKEELEDENPDENPTGDVSLKDITIGYNIITDNPAKLEKAINNLDNYGDKQRQAVTIAQNIKKSDGGESKTMKLIPSGNAAGRNNIVKWSLTNVWAKLNKQERLTKLDQVFKAYSAEGKDIGEALKTIILKFDKEADLSDDTKIKEYIANLEASSPIFTKVGGGNNIGYPIFRKGYFYPIFTQKELERSPLRKDYEYTIDNKDGKSEFTFLVKDNPLADVNMGNTDAYRDLLKRIAKDADEKLNTLSKQVFSDTGEDANSTVAAPIKEPTSGTTNFIKTFIDDEGAPDEDSADLFYSTIFSDFPDADIADNKITINDITPAEKKDLINRYLKFQQSNKLYENKSPMNPSIKEQIKQIAMEVLQEKELTKAKLKKRNKNAEKIKKANPDMDKGEAFAIATKQLKEGEGSLKNWETEPAKWDSVKPGDFIADGPDAHEVAQVISNSRRGLELKRVWTNSKKHPVGEEFFIKHDHTAMKDEKDDNLFKVTNYTKEPNSLSESNMSMDELMQQFVDALDIEDDNEANQIIKNIGIAIKNKVKTGASNLYQKARTGLAKQYDADLNE
jgi:hypothetical protein